MPVSLPVRLLSVLLLLALGCGRAEPELPPVTPVALPSLEGLPESAQEQLRLQHARTRGAEVPGEAYGAFGELLFTYDFLDAAEAAFRNARALEPENLRWPYFLGMLARQQGRFEEAAGFFEQVLAEDPDDRFARLRLAEARIETGRAEEAAALLDAVLDAEPRHAFAHFLRGQLAYEAGAFQEAVTHFEAVLAVQPAATQVHAPLGLAYRNLGDEAQSQYHLARRGQAVVQLRDPRVIALEALKQASGATGLTEGQRLIEAARYTEALAVLQQTIAQDSTNASTWLSLGVARAYTGDAGGAVAAFEQSLRIDSTQSKPHYNLGALYEAAGQPDQAAMRYRAALRHDVRHLGAHRALAELLRRGGQCRAAIPHFEQTLALAPGEVAPRQHFALCLLQVGRDAEARAALEAGLAANPEHLGYVDALARVLAASPADAVRDGAEALRLAEKALALRRRPETLETAAMAYAEMGRYNEAVAVQNEAIRAAEQAGHAGYLAHLRTNLRRYEQRQPSRTPWPAFMYEQ